MSDIRLPTTNHQISKWLVKSGASVRKGETIAHINVNGSNKDKLLAPTAGFISIFSVRQNASTCSRSSNNRSSVAEVVAKIEACAHPAVLGKLCAVCGVVVDGDGDASGERTRDYQGVSSQRALTVNGGVTLSISEKEAQSLGDQNRQRLHLAKKLSLVLDLDHTLVHATADPRASKFVATDDDVRVLLLTTTVRHGAGYRPAYTRHFVKLRPHINEFFKDMCELYEVSIYTAGTREYALKIADLICRHIVGAKDEDEIMSMKFSVEALERSIKSKQHAKTEKDEATKSGSDLPDDSKCNLNTEKNDSIKSTTKMDVIDESTTPLISIDSIDGSQISPNGKTKLFTGIDLADNMKGTLDTDRPENNNKKAIESSESINGSIRATEVMSKEPIDEDNVEPQRKRVRFTESLPSAIEKDITNLKELKAELTSALDLESQAQKLSQTIFGSRIISRTDVGDLGRDVKDLSRVFPCGGTMSTILDDREDVWANARSNLSVKRPGEPPLNLLLVRPYHWTSFAEAGFSDVNNASGADLSEPGSSTSAIDEDDIQLQWTADILNRLHKSYYRYHDIGKTKSVPSILSEMRKNVFGDKPTHILLSGMLPLHLQNRLNDKSRPRSPYIRYCEDLGAKVIQGTHQNVTHIIAAKEGTDKVKWGLQKQGCYVVKAAWLLTSFWSLTRFSEKSFRFDIQDKPDGSTKSEDTDNSDESDTDFEAEMEMELFG